MRTQGTGFDEAENDSSFSSKSQQLHPLALTIGTKVPNDVIKSGSTPKKSTAVDVKAEESEDLTPSAVSPLTHNPTTGEAEDPLHLEDNTLADGSPMNSSVHSEEEETRVDPGSNSLFKAVLAVTHSSAVNGAALADDIPLSLCVSKRIENSATQKEISTDEDKPTTSTDSMPKPPPGNPSPALTPPASPTVAPEEEARGSATQVPAEEDAAPDKDAPTETSPALDPEMDKATLTEEGHEVSEHSAENTETSVPAPSTPQNQPPRPDKPYCCSHCGKAYASRSGLKVRLNSVSSLKSTVLLIRTLLNYPLLYLFLTGTHENPRWSLDKHAI